MTNEHAKIIKTILERFPPADYDLDRMIGSAIYYLELSTPEWTPERVAGLRQELGVAIDKAESEAE